MVHNKTRNTAALLKAVSPLKKAVSPKKAISNWRQPIHIYRTLLFCNSNKMLDYPLKLAPVAVIADIVGFLIGV